MKHSIFDKESYENLTRRIHLLTSEMAPLWGKMSVDQMLRHCTDVLKVGVGENPLKDESNFFTRTFIKWLVLSEKPMMKNAPTSPHFKHDGEKFEIQAEKNELLRVLEKAHHLTNDSERSAHNLFGKMSAEEWSRITYKHIDHHLRQFGV